MAEKLTDELTVKLSPTGKRFVSTRAKQLGMESSGEYIRHLISVDQERAISDFNLLAEALGCQINQENQTAESAGRE